MVSKKFGTIFEVKRRNHRYYPIAGLKSIEGPFIEFPVKGVRLLGDLWKEGRVRFNFDQLEKKSSRDLMRLGSRLDVRITWPTPEETRWFFSGYVVEVAPQSVELRISGEVRVE